MSERLSDASTLRSTVYAERGMVAAAHPLAAAAGLRVLARGGNAVDAAIAAGAATWVTMPGMCGPGGDAFLLVYHAKTGTVTAINGSGAVGSRANPEYLAARGYTDLMPGSGLLAAAIPGAVAAFDEALGRFGTQSWDELLQDAIHYAEGHPLAPKVAAAFQSSREKLAKFPSSARIYLRDGQPPRSGDILRQPEYAETLRRLARGGATEFYRGELGARIGAATAAEGLFDAEELAAHRSEAYTPLSVSYRGYQIVSHAPPAQGLLHLESQLIAAQFDLAGLPAADVEHVLIEANKIATADRLAWAGDPKFVQVPLAELLSTGYARRRAAEIRLDGCLPVDVAGDPHGDTTYLCVVDGEGNAVSLIHSLSHAFGCGQVVEGTGLFLNNRAGRGFDLREGHPNCIAPGKRTMSTLGCYMVMQEGRPYLVGGTPGGDGQPQWNLQVLTRFLDFGFNVQEACEAPRWTRQPATDPAVWGDPAAIKLESRFDPAVIEGLRGKGHPVQVIGPWASTGAVQLIHVDRVRGVLHGGSDPRADGAALGY